MAKNIYKGSWWFNNRRKHLSYIVKSNNKDFFETRIISHKRQFKDDIELNDNPNINDSSKAYMQKKKYIETTKKSFGSKLSGFKLSKRDKKKIKKDMTSSN